MIMPSPGSVMLPSLFFRVMETGQIGKVAEAHPTGTRIRFEYEIKSHSLENLVPVTEKEYEDYKVTKQRKVRNENASIRS